VKIVMITCAAIWLIQVAVLAFARYDLTRVLGLVPSRVVQGWLWQPLSYIFLHSPRDIFHLFFNMLMLWMFGGELERYWGSRAWLRYFLVCGVGAGVIAVPFAYFVTGYVDAATVGASGALFGLFMAYGIVFAERTVLFMLIFPLKARTMALIMFAVAFFYTLTQPGGGISHIAHLGGAVVGFLYLKRAWRVGEFYREMKWKLKRRRFKVMPPNDRDDFDRWVN
jgi:membrane associated rhomboid family serine protease